MFVSSASGSLDGFFDSEDEHAETPAMNIIAKHALMRVSRALRFETGRIGLRICERVDPVDQRANETELVAGMGKDHAWEIEMILLR